MTAHVEVDIVHTQRLERLLKSFLHIRMMGIPELAREEDLAARHAAILDSRSHFVFVALDTL